MDLYSILLDLIAFAEVAAYVRGICKENVTRVLYRERIMHVKCMA